MWTRCVDKLPPDRELVLCVHDGRRITRQTPTGIHVGIGYRSDDGKAGRWNVCYERYYMYHGCLWPDAESVSTWGEVTHWAPLPEPPNVDEQYGVGKDKE